MVHPPDGSFGHSALRRHGRVIIGLLLGLLLLTTSDSAHPAPTYAAVSLKPGDFLLSDWAHRQIWIVDGSNGIVSPLLADPFTDRHMHYPSGVFTGPNGEVYFSDGYYFFGDGTERAVVARLNPVTGLSSVLPITDFNSLSGILVAPDSRLILVYEGRVVHLDPITGQQSTVFLSSRLNSPYDMALERDGSIVVTVDVPVDTTQRRQIVRLRAPSYTQEIVGSSAVPHWPYFIAVSPDGSIFTIDIGPPLTPSIEVQRVDPYSGTQQLVARWPSDMNIGGMIADGSGVLYLSATGGSSERVAGVIRIDPRTGERRAFGDDVHLLYPGSIALVQVASPLPCPRDQRSPVTVRTSALGNGRLLVSVHAAGSPNAIRAIRLGNVPGNAVLESQPSISGADATFVLRRTGPGAVTLPFTVADACGDWPTFVGGGPSAF